MSWERHGDEMVPLTRSNVAGILLRPGLPADRLAAIVERNRKAAVGRSSAC
jgi:malate/lactate dehydrogenase